VNGLLDAVSLLTRVPTRAGENFKRALPWFPVVGAAVGLFIAGVDVLCRLRLSSLLSAAIAIGAGVMLTGALHEDGLADTADALGAGGDRDRALAILKDPRHGTYGVVAVALSLVIRTAAVASLHGRTALAVLPAAHGLSRGATVATMAASHPAAESGLGATYGPHVTRAVALVSSAAAVALAVALLGWWGIAAEVLVVACALAAANVSERRFGGITGDILGAVEQVAEVGVLVLAAAVGRGLPWWPY
jgi:adenosylcobinamide-GDP ribazoletransferase